jgi:methyl acetate hydrolase
MSEAIDEVLAAAVASGAVPNAVGVVADRDGVVYEGAAGPRAVGGDVPVDADSMFRIASMTKMVATVALLQQVERGAVDLDAPVERYLPDFGRVQVLEGFDGDTPVLRAPASQATVRHLATHTSGLSYWFWNADIVRWEKATGSGNALSGTKDTFDAPMVADPGTRFEYGINSDWLGRVVEAASGQSLDAYLDEHVLGPLGMTSTTFLMNDEQRSRSVPVHVPAAGGWVATDLDWNQHPDWWAGGHGLYSTPRDYLTFQRMLLGGGALDGVRVLSEQSMADAFTNQIGDLEFPAAIATADPVSTCDFNAGPGWKWGWGLLLNTEQQPGMRAAGSGAWAGICNTHFWVDPASGVTAALHTQFLPFVTPAAWQAYTDFEKAVYASL